jgi:MFS family permease
MLKSPTSSISVPLGGAIAWWVWSLSALSFGYAFFQRVAPSVMVSDLMAEFSVGAAVLGQLSALYFYPYALLQIPIGLLLDRFGPRLLLSGSMAIAAAGTVAFALAGTIELAYAGRFLVGTGSAVGFIGSLTLASKWFPPHRYALLIGLTMLVAMSCGFAGQAPLAAAIGAYGWRTTMLASGVAAALLATMIFLFVRDMPPGVVSGQTRSRPGWSDLWLGLRRVAKSGDVWVTSIVAMAMSGPMLAFGGLWGVPYIMTAYGLPRPEAALLVSLTLVGWAIGAPAGGWLSDHIRLRKAPVVVATALLTLLIGLLVAIPGLPLWATVAVMIGIGYLGRHMTITYGIARDLTPPSVHGSVSGLVNGINVASGAVLQPLIGILLDAVWTGEMAGGVRVYQAADYRLAFISLLLWALMGFIGSLFLRETRCRPVEFAKA